MRILLICEAFRSLGGVQEVVDNLATELDALGHHVAVLSTPSASAEPRTVRFTGECRYGEIASRRPVTLRHLERLWRPLSSDARQLAASIAAFHPDVVHSNCWSWDRLPVVAGGCRRAGVPMVHSLFDSWGAGKLGAAALSCLSGAAALTALSDATRRFFEPIVPSARNARVIIGGVDPDGPRSAASRDHPRPYVLCAARLDIRHKAIDELIRGFALVAPQSPGLDLLISGDGPDRSALEKLAAAAGLAGRVRFVGIVERSRLWSLYKNSELFAMPSRMPEGLGLVFLEAMACGVPVIATRSGGTPEIVEHGRTGLLLESNTPAEISTAIRRLLNDAGRRRTIGEQAREAVVSRFTWRHFARQYEEVYRLCPGANRVESQSASQR